MATDLIEKMKNLPPGWWRRIEACVTLTNAFKKYLVSFFISYHTSTQALQTNFSGFLLEYEGHLLWITAEHVIDTIRELLGNSAFRIQNLSWLDNHVIPKAGAIVIADKNLQMYSASELDCDIGVVALGSWETLNLRTNVHTAAFTETAWKKIDDAEPEGFYIVGYPEELNEVTDLEKVNGKARKQFEAHAVCLPVKRIAYDDLTEEQKSVWTNPDSFYGKILSFLGTDEELSSIVGLSGGPIISIERDFGKGFRYRLYGIQSSWLKDSRIIKGETILTLDDFVKSKVAPDFN